MKFSEVSDKIVAKKLLFSGIGRLNYVDVVGVPSTMGLNNHNTVGRKWRLSSYMRKNIPQTVNNSPWLLYKPYRIHLICCRFLC